MPSSGCPEEGTRVEALAICPFTRFINALKEGDYATASSLQAERYDKVEEFRSLYDSYIENMI